VPVEPDVDEITAPFDDLDVADVEARPGFGQ